MKDVVILRDLECIKAIAHPRRIDILNTFEEEPLSAKRLSQLLDEPHAKINYHIKTLYKVGILELVEEKIKSGIVEKYYYPTAKNIVIDKNVINLYLHNKGGNISISKFEDIANLFYEAAEEDVLENGVIEYGNITLTKEEIIELNSAIKSKVEEIVGKRDNAEIDAEYSSAFILIPKSKKEAFDQA